VRDIAARANIVVVAGMFVPSEDGDRVTNTLIATGPGVDARYDKIHLYDAFGFAESKTVAPGREPVVITVDGVTVGLTLCYDIRFPELYVELADRGAELITAHASWGTGPGKLEQWTLLARARAIDTNSVVAAVGQAYPGDEIAALGPTGVGGSVVASALGDVVCAAGDEPQLLVCDIDLEAARKARETVAVMHNRSGFAQRGKAQSRA
jgi:deaminated glutathione amidase